ncbi:MAG: transglutaminase-like domain-containing protein [Oscillospiraceae bacterium]|nr:transglutaminase-like domain-containing protein [Oscillospiraceae bacterium]
MKRIICLLMVLALAVGAAPISTAANSGQDVWRFSYDDGILIEAEGSSLRFVNLPREALVYIVRGGVIVKKDTLRGTASIDLSGLSNGTYNVEIYLHSSGAQYMSYVFEDDLQVKKTTGRLTFEDDASYAGNIKIHTSKRTDEQAREYYKMPSAVIQSDSAEIIAKANELSKGVKPGIDEVRKITDWVSANVWYDMDSLKLGRLPATDAVSTLKTGRGICDNYSNLSAALLRARGYAAKIIYGYSGGIGHSWLEVFADGYVIIIDPTFNSGNIWEGGKKTQSEGVYTHRYFDADMRAFSRDHQYRDYSEAMIPAARTTSVPAIPFAGKIRLNGATTDQAMVNISGNNRSQLRMLAVMFADTNKPFDVLWDGNNNAVVINTGTRYAPGNSNAAEAAATVKNAVPTTSRLIWDGRLIYADAFNIDGSNYFGLRDICRMLDVYVEWKSRESLIVVDTLRGYINN